MVQGERGAVASPLPPPSDGAEESRPHQRGKKHRKEKASFQVPEEDAGKIETDDLNIRGVS